MYDKNTGQVKQKNPLQYHRKNRPQRGKKNAQDLFTERVHTSKSIHCVQLSLTTDSRTSEVTGFITCSFSLDIIYVMGLSPACVSAVISHVRDYFHAFSMNFHNQKQAAVLWETVAVKWMLWRERTTPFTTALEGMEEAETWLMGSGTT